MDLEKVNILYIFSDQHRRFDLGCYGNEYVVTPNLDTLAQNGLRFTNCVSNSPVCVPARGTLLTGLMPHQHKAFCNDLPIDYNCVSIADVLRKAGYHTGYMGKWHLAGVPRDQSIDQKRRMGFQTWKVANCNHKYLNCYYDDEQNVRHYIDGYEPEVFGQLALEFLEERKNQSDPWALFLSFATPHTPFDAIPQKYIDLYPIANIHLRPNVKEKIRGMYGHFIDIEEYKEKTRGYFGHITAIDEQVGKIVDKLEQLGVLENTIIFYSSDHGEMLGSQGEKDKQLPYEESIGIPLIAYWKNKIRTGVCEELIGLDDLPVTISSLVNASFPRAVHGKDLSRLFFDEKAVSYDSTYLCEYFPAHQASAKGMTAWRGIRTKRYTYAVQPGNPNWLLFDNESDPYQLNNLAGNLEYSAVQQELWEILKRHIDENDCLLNGLEYVTYAGAEKEFNRSQRYFRQPVLAAEMMD